MRDRDGVGFGTGSCDRGHSGRRAAAKIVVNYSNSKKEAEETADLCRKAGAEVLVVQGDVSRDEDCKKIAAAANAWGRLDILVNNAGTTKHVPHDNMDGLSRGGFSAHLCRQHDRAVPDDPRRARRCSKPAQRRPAVRRRW